MRSKALHILSILLLTVGMATTARGQSKIKIHGNVYGGGDQAAIKGNTNVTINKGEYGGSIFGGGNGALNNDGSVKSSADIGTHKVDGTLEEGTGDTHVTINGGEIVYVIGDEDNLRNIYGGGNMACNVAGSTNVTMTKGMITAYSFTSDLRAMAAWRYFYDNSMKPNQQKIPICSVFGAGYGAHTDVAGNTNVNINIPGTASIKPADGVAFTHDELEAIDKLALRLKPDTKLSEQFVPAVHGGGFDGTVGAYDKDSYDKDNTDPTHAINYKKTTYTSQTNITIQGQPFVFNVFGGGLGSKSGADATGGVNSYVGAVYGATKVDIQGGLYNGSVYGGGAGIEAEDEIDSPFGGGGKVKLPYTYAAQVMRETDVAISGNTTIIYGNVYGGGDIANTGWYYVGARPQMEGHVAQQNHSLATLDYTTSLNLNGGNILGSVFGGGNGRTKAQMTMSMFVGTVCGSTNVSLNGTKVWSHVYGGGNMGMVFTCQTIAASKGESGRTMVPGVTDGCTNVAVLDGMVAKDIFGGGFGGDPGTGDANVTSADIYGNTYVYLEKADLEYTKYWKPREFLPSDATYEQMLAEVTGRFLDQSSASDKRNTESDITHNLYGGGNMACTVKGNSHVYMTGAPIAPADFSTTDYYKECIANVAKPHFSVFGGGFGINAKINGNALSDINLVRGTGFHSIIGGGMNGPVGGMCKVHVGNDPLSRVHHVYGGGYYAPCEKTELNITRGTIVQDVFGGSVMGNITPYKRDNDGNLILDGEGNPQPDVNLYATKTVIGLQDGGAGRHSSVDLDDEHGYVLRSYTYTDHKNEITIGGNVYGANDVSGTVNGLASLTIYGGTIQGQVYGAGNGNHVGYYVPNELKYNMGAHGTANYYYVDHSTHNNGPKGNTYVGRPQTIGGVELTLEGNTEAERVKVLGQVFGGGNSCTIGAWDKSMLAEEGKYHGDPHLTRDDPDYFQGGGKLYVNIGSHVTIGRTHTELADAADGSTYIDNGENVSGLFMGCSGRNLATQNGDYEHDNYYHHYYNYNAGKYYPGFAVGDELGKEMTRAEQLKPFQAYLNNVMIWTDDVRLRINNHDGSAAEDVWLANFVGGGFRGSMRAKTAEGTFDYVLPEGVTIGHTVVGGAYNAHVKYHLFESDTHDNFIDGDNDGVYDYATEVPGGWTKVDPDDPAGAGEYIDELHEDPDDPTKITSILRYNFNGGILSENSTGVNASPVGHHIHQVHADPRADGISDTERKKRYATSYFEPLNDDDPKREANADELFTANKDKVLLHLDLQCAMEPEVLTDTKGTYLHGGNVFGGCFLSGFVEGDSWVDYNCWLSPNCTDATYFSKDNNLKIYDVAMDVERNNALNAYGAGYGTDTHSMGDVYLSIKAIEQDAGGDDDTHGHFPYMFNAFGGSNMGEVDGNVNVYYAVGKQGTLLGSLYGGGFKGVINGNTFVELAEGFVNNVYGGSRQADIMGATHVWAYDGKARGIANANHLIICNLYGGNDIAGTIHGTMPAYFTEAKWSNTREPIAGHTFNTYVEISADDESADRGFPLVGSAFAGGNGEAWVSEVESGAKPNVAKALIEIDGGSTLRAFGGGNMATVTDSTFIFTDAKSKNFAEVEFTQYQKNIVQNIFFRDVTVGYKWEESKLTMDNFHVARLFGGNNLATMDIQPTWNLKNGRLENVYSGGNMGDMTYYNPAGKPATQNGAIGESAGVENNTDGSNANYSPRGLSITIDQPDIYIGSLFGGCRLSDVKPNDTKPDDYDEAEKGEWKTWPEGTDGEDFYGATVNISDGYIENVYGGNDISGKVYHGTNVNISGAVSGNVYGSGNGFYLYKWDKDIDWESNTENPYQSDVIEEFNTELKELVYHVKPTGDKSGWDTASDTKKLLTINNYRPSVDKAFLNVAGVENYHYIDQHGADSTAKRVAYVKGNVFCGGNASTIIGDESFTKFKIGSYVTLNGVFMGSDGKAYTENDQIARFAELNGFDDMGADTEASDFPDYTDGKSLDQSHNPILLNIYMMAVDMKAQPKDFNLNLPLKEAHIGTYCGGGNRGSMLVDKTVTLPFHHDIIIYDKIVAACLDANIEFNDGKKKIYSMGGYTRKISDNATYGNKKFKLDIASQFVPLVMDVPADKNPATKNSHGENFETAKKHGFLYDNRQKGVKYTYEEFNKLFETEYTSDEEFLEHEGGDHIWKIADGVYAPSCNIYGGCYQSGEVEGDVELNIYSNMLRYVDKEDLDKSIANNIPCFNVYGAGFGQNSHVWGNVTINMDRCLDTSTMGNLVANSNLSAELTTLLGDESNWDIQHSTTPANNLLGIANAYQYPSFNNVIGGGRNGKLIGNTTVEIRNGLVYTDVAGGCYASDMYGSTQVIVGYPKYYKCLSSGEYALDRADKWNTTKLDGDGNPVIKPSVWYLKGDLVPDNVYQQIIAKTSDYASNFEEVVVTPTTKHQTDGTTWNDVAIKIGKGIYGGGYSLENSMAASAGSVTTYKLLDDSPTITDIYPHNFSGRYGYDEPTFAGYGGNSSVMLGDMDATDPDNFSYTDRDHIRVSTLKATVANIPATSSVIGKFIKETVGGKEVYTHQGDHTPVGGTTYYTLTGDGGIYGDGHLTFCEGFRSADVTRYGWADGTAKHPILMNTFQRMDLLSVNDCCLMLQGAQDFATDQIDATIYSITRINEMRLNSTLDADATLGEISAHSGSGEGTKFDTKKQRNYLAFFNNVHYLGSIVTNDAFTDGFHNNQGAKTSGTYFSKKLDFITNYTKSTPDAEGNKTAEATTTFKQRNVATARNAIGINNGYCLRIQNQEYVGAHQSQTYYGPIVGVCEVKLLTLVQGEGGGYVYADNIHENPDVATGEDHFLMTSGNFVFPGIIDQGEDPITHENIGDQYIVDDCFVQHFGTPGNITQRDASKPHLDEAHYWYVEGNKYFFNTTLTGFTYQHKLDFDLIKTDPNIVLSGMENGSRLNIKKIEWLSTEDGFHRNNYEPVLPSTDTETDDGGNTIDKISDYEFDIFVGGNDIDDWHNDMPRYSVPASGSFTTGKTVQNDHLPQFNIRLQDKLNNSGDAAYKNHLDEPELVKIYFEGKTTDANGVEQTYEYTITVNVVYLQGPTVTGGVKIENCALPGELIGFSTSGLKVKTPELMPITAASWQILPLSEIDEHGEWKWDIDHGIVIPKSSYEEKTDDENNTIVTGTIPAYYKQNEYTIAYIFTAGGYDFPVMPEQTVTIPKENRMIVVHNYHRMKDVFVTDGSGNVIRDLLIETMPSTIPDNQAHTYHPKFAEAKLYIEDEADLHAFIEYLNLATEGNVKNIPVGLDGLDIILQKDITLTEPLPAISQAFAGNFHGDGYRIELGEYGDSFFGGNLTGNVYNLGLVGGTIASTGTSTNCYELKDSKDLNDSKVLYGSLAYKLSHYFTPTADGYVEGRYANGDYQYATTDRVWSLRTSAPNYGHKDTHHDQLHTHDAARWKDTDNDGEADTNIPLHDGTSAVADHTVDVSGNGTEYFTYRGLPANYANDYLFFGQHLDKINADAYPVHIEPVANGDADGTKGGNRVYETAGFYQSKADQKFHYNKDAWALNPSLTAIDYTTMTAEGDGAVTLPTKFSVDSNKDYSSYSNETTGHVSQNLLVYNAGQDDVFAYSDTDNSDEADVAYHNIANGSTDYFHLVDKQDFNAPIEFGVNTRAWYERMPQNYRSGDINGWEGICLPFTATHVEADVNGEISHFYGNSVLNHEYWLRGLTAVADDKATFSRVGKEGTEGTFVDDRQEVEVIDEYKYKNTYFASLDNYNGDPNFGKHYADAATDDDVTFADYIPLTASVPYIIALPGNDYYEFSMEGSVYSLDTHSKTGNPQAATFENTNVSIAVSDEENQTSVANGFSHIGSYIHTTGDYTLDAKGNAFDQENGTVIPFRTYITAASSMAAPHRLLIEDWYQKTIEEEEEPEEAIENLKISVRGRTIVVESPFDLPVDIQVHTLSGHLVYRHTATKGITSFTLPQAGIYLIGRKKISVY